MTEYLKTHCVPASIFFRPAKVYWFFLFMMVYAMSCTLPAKKEAPKDDIPAEPIRVDDGNLHYLTTMPDGRIISLNMLGAQSEEMLEPGPVIIRYSHNNGLKWTEGDTAFSYPKGKGGAYGGFPLADSQGNLHCFGLRFLRLAQDDIMGHSVLLHNRSSDGGKTWTELKPVNFGHDYTGSINTVIELTSGRLVLALSYTSSFLEDRKEFNNKIVSIYSDDLGDSWQVGSDNIVVPRGDFKGHPGALEPVMVALQDERIWMIIRTQQGRFYQAFSSDRGESWSETSPTDFMAPNAPGGILRLADGRLVFCWNDLSQFPDRKVEGSGRQYLHIAISSDDGKTWSTSKQIAQREPGERPDTNVAYPYLTESQDGQILVSYHRVGNREGVTWWRPIVEVLRIDPDWIAYQRSED